jgi:hypothetical protein
MRVNVYAEEMTDRIEIIEKEIDGRKFTALRFYLALPATDATQQSQCPDCVGSGYREDDYCSTCGGHKTVPRQVQGPFIHRPGDDDSAAVTFWGKDDLRIVLRKALAMLDEHYAWQPTGWDRWTTGR